MIENQSLCKKLYCCECKFILLTGMFSYDMNNFHLKWNLFLWWDIISCASKLFQWWKMYFCDRIFPRPIFEGVPTKIVCEVLQFCVNLVARLTVIIPTWLGMWTICIRQNLDRTSLDTTQFRIMPCIRIMKTDNY